MTVVLPDRMAVAHSNHISATNIDTVTYSGLTPVSGFSEDNLKYPDPGRLFKFTADSSTFYVDITFNTSESVKAAGILRHNLGTSHIGTTTLTIKDPTVSRGSTPITVDADHLALLDTAYGMTTIRFEFSGSGVPSGTLYLGAVFVAGFSQELTTNPTDGLLEVSRESSIAVQESSGGSRHFLSLGDRDRVDMSFETRRARRTDVAFFNKTLAIESRHTMLGVLAPWENQSSGVTDIEHFFGYIEKIRSKPRFSAATDVRYDLAVDFIGA